MPGMWRTLAVGVFSLSLVVSEIPANAQPDNVDAGANYSVFLQAIAGDGVMMNGRQAVLEGQAVCELMQPPDGGSLWDAGRHVLSMHPDWGIGLALHFADRSVQNICPHRGSF